MTRNPETRYSQGDNPTAISRYTLAVDRRFRREGQPDADFIRCVAFGRSAEFADRYFTQGMRVAVSGRIQTGSYTNRDGGKSENNAAPMPSAPGSAAPAASAPASSQAAEDPGDGFMNIPEGIDEELPFN